MKTMGNNQEKQPLTFEEELDNVQAKPAGRLVQSRGPEPVVPKRPLL